MKQDPKTFPVNLAEVMRARNVIGRYLKPTQLIRYESLSRETGAEIYVKHENHNPTGTFKIRGGVNLLHHLSQGDTSGVITFSTGNHGLSIATAAAWFGLDAVIVVPENNNPAKNRAIELTGAELIEAGRDFEEAAETVEALVEGRGLYYAHPANEPHLINGAGSEAAAAIITLRAFRPGVEIIAVQAARSPAAYESWRTQQPQTAENATFAGGFATGMAYELPFSIYRQALSDFVLLTEQEIVESIAMAMHHTHNLAEGAGASTLMAAVKLKDKLHRKRVVLQMSGCNASSEEIRQAAAVVHSSTDTNEVRL